MPGVHARHRPRAARVAASSVATAVLLAAAIAGAPAAAVTASSVLEVTSADDLALDAPGVACPAADDDVCTLRAATQVASSDEDVVAIELEAATYELTIPPDESVEDEGATGSLLLERDAPITVRGVAGAVIDGGWRPSGHPDGAAPGIGDRLLTVRASEVHVEQVSFTGGYVDHDEFANLGAGGAINADGVDRTLTLRDTTFADNSAVAGGAISVTGARGIVDVEDSRFERNEARDVDPDDTRYEGTGGAIRLASTGQLTVDGSTFVDNHALDDGGAIFLGARSSVDLVVTDSEFTDNRVTPTGYPGFDSPLNNGGGAVGWSPNIGADDGDIRFTDVTFRGNDAGDGSGGAVRGGGGTFTRTTFDANAAARAGALQGGTIEVVDSTFTDNEATQPSQGGGAISGSREVVVRRSTIAENHAAGDGGAISTPGSNHEVTLEDTTLSANSAGGRGGAVHVPLATTLTTTSATLVGNSADGEGGTVYVAPGSEGFEGRFVPRNTVVVGDDACAGPGVVVSAGHNLDAGATCGLEEDTDLGGLEPRLGALADNGGPTATHLPEADGPLVDAGPAAGDDGCAGTDQRGTPRPQGERCDIGAVEVERASANTPPVAVDDTAETVAGEPVTIDVLANDRDADGDDLEVTGATGGEGATVEVDGPSITYAPADDFSGEDRFTYSISDGRGGTASATVVVTVTPGDDDTGDDDPGEDDPGDDAPGDDDSGEDDPSDDDTGDDDTGGDDRGDDPSDDDTGDERPLRACDDAEDAFADDDGTVHEPAIDCLHAIGLLVGFDDGTVRPAGAITRGQAASMLLRTIVFAADRPADQLCPDAEQPFGDSGASTHGRAIACLHDLGLVEGYADGTFRPSTPIDRAQIASLLQRLAQHLGIELPVAVPVGFVDVPSTSPHARAIEELTAAGVIEGYGPTSFGPTDGLTRGQMASLLHRLLRLHHTPPG